jgi:leukotriene-A4 hydrolase
MNTATSIILGLFMFLIVALEVADSAWARPPVGLEPAREGSGRPDPHSYGNPDQVRVSQVFLELTVDFEHRMLKGAATLDISRAPGCPADAPLVLDTRGLLIEGVGLRKLEFFPKAFRPTTHQLGPADPILGSRLTIDLNPEAMQVRIAYHTEPSAGALQWLEPTLTAGKVKPYLFTQSQAIHARSWIPLQDSPAVRVAFVAMIRVPAGLTAVMAAESRTRQEDRSHGLYNFVMAQPIPPYLIALAVGDLAFAPLGRRTGVWAEPSVLKAAANEFVDVEQMVQAAEKRCGFYRWGRYDILVLPPSFPFGGMENPRLTFATPTILAGDRSLVSLVAHELAHSWSGNLVTSATWRDFWLNEGFTTYIERRIIEDMYGRDRADMEAVLGLAELRAELKRLPENDQILHIDLQGRDPDEGMTKVPYEKGALFLRTIEQTFGRARFDAFIHLYFDEHVFQSITTADFEAFLRDRLFRHDPESARSIDLTAWLERPGLPADFAEPKSERLAAIDQIAKGWLSNTVATDTLGAKEWSTQEWLRFLQALPERLPVERMAELDKSFGLTARGNAEIAHQWLLICIHNRYKPADPRLESYLTTIGRRKLVLPLYEALIATHEGRERARKIYSQARPNYHPITIASIDRLFKDAR